jgi:hypothetical protein
VEELSCHYFEADNGTNFTVQIHRHQTKERCAIQQAQPCLFSALHTAWQKQNSRYGICCSLLVYIIYVNLISSVFLRHEINFKYFLKDSRQLSIGFIMYSIMT